MVCYLLKSEVSLSMGWPADSVLCPMTFSLALSPSTSADEMGLGKTLQTISLLSYLKFERNVQVGWVT